MHMHYLIEYLISIHAPREGCDGSLHELEAQADQFQSTHPARGATGAFCLQDVEDKNFNPRTPRGVRHELEQMRAEVDEISIHAPREGCDSKLY